MAEINIENIIATTKLANKFEIKSLSKTIEDANNNQGDFPGLVLHFKDPKTASFILETGKILLTGGKNISEIEETIEKTKTKIKDAGFSVFEKSDISILNIVASSTFYKELNLVNMSKNPLLGNVEYNPERFPGIIIRTDDKDAVVILFNSGKVVCTGFRKIEDASNSINKIEDKLMSMGVL